jgi:hypothetical protein
VQPPITFAGILDEEGKDDAAKYSRARPLYERALAIQELNLRPAAPETSSFLGRYADFLVKIPTRRMPLKCGRE